MSNTINNALYPRPVFTSASHGSSAASGTMLTVSSSSTASSFATSSFDTFTQLVFVDVQQNNVVVTFDGTTPAYGTRGHILASGTNYTWQLSTLANAQFTLTTSSATAYLFASQFNI